MESEKLIEVLLSDENTKVKPGLRSGTYRDRPILMTAAQMESYTPSRYREMRKIAGSVKDRGTRSPELFYKQGKFMEDFEDSFSFRGDFYAYCPSYQVMNDRQLRGYFSWRTQVRQGKVEKTFAGFVFLYFYELLNGIGAATPEESHGKMRAFWESYRELDPVVNMYLRTWLRDHVVYHGLDKSLLEAFVNPEPDNHVLKLLHYREHSPEEVLEALNTFSSYDIKRSKFYKEYPEDVAAAAYRVFGALSEKAGKAGQRGLCEAFFGKRYFAPCTMFSGAVHYQKEPPRDRVYEINEIYRYRCRNGRWSCERFFPNKCKNPLVGGLLKTLDFLMRRAYGFKTPLKPGQTPKTWQDIMRQEVEDYLEEKRELARPRIEIDVSLLPGIREAAREIQDRLTVEEPTAGIWSKKTKAAGALKKEPAAGPSGTGAAGPSSGDAALSPVPKNTGAASAIPARESAGSAAFSSAPETRAAAELSAGTAFLSPSAGKTSAIPALSPQERRFLSSLLSEG
ncbi:MAG: TerB N-terminal domain-containing protein, partial [Bacillota bacterium]|nr:TerB N-terminal domain-containing protein [Bacillota bacterium]